MRKHLYIKFIFLILVTMTFACNDSTFVPDPIDPRLPKYTESGNNVAGAFINQEVWKSAIYSEYVDAGTWGPPDSLVYRQVPQISINSDSDYVVIRFDGKISSDNTSLEFHLSALNIYNFDDFALLKDKKIQLDGITNMGVYIRHSGTSEEIKNFKEGGIGQLYFKNATVVDSTKTATLSGTFGFSITNLNNQVDEISYGRFDFTFQDTVNFVNVKPLR
jgi:hypothetical protein